MIEKLKNSLKAKYDIVDDEIVGATEGSIVWHHENRHKQQFNNYYLKEIASWLNVVLVSFGAIFIMFGLIDGMLREAIYGTGLFALPLIAFNLAIEIDAWQYCLRKYYSEDKHKTNGDSQ